MSTTDEHGPHPSCQGHGQRQRLHGHGQRTDGHRQHEVCQGQGQPMYLQGVRTRLEVMVGNSVVTRGMRQTPPPLSQHFKGPPCVLCRWIVERKGFASEMFRGLPNTCRAAYVHGQGGGVLAGGMNRRQRAWRIPVRGERRAGTGRAPPFLRKEFDGFVGGRA